LKLNYANGAIGHLLGEKNGKEHGMR